VKGLSDAREAIVSVLEETHTSDEQLGQLLEFNRLVQTGDYESALKVVNAQRTALLKSLGREEPGVDLLSEFPDLVQDVEDEKIDRKRALELAGSRRAQAVAAARERERRGQEDAKSEREREFTAQRDRAANEIDEWTKELARTDVDFKAKEAKLLEQSDSVFKNYAPRDWLKTLKIVYSNMSVSKPAALPGTKDGPLRPSGARPGTPAPGSMKEAIDQGLGYSSQ